MNILILVKDLEGLPILDKLLAEDHSVRVSSLGVIPFDYFEAGDVEENWSRSIRWADVAVLSHPSPAFRFVRSRLPTVGGSDDFYNFISRQGDVYYKLGIPASSKLEYSRTTWGVFTGGGFVVSGGHKRGVRILDKLTPYLEWSGFRGPLAVRWTRHIFTTFVVDVSLELGYSLLISSEFKVGDLLKECIS